MDWPIYMKVVSNSAKVVGHLIAGA